VNRSDSKKSLPLWVALLVLPILALAAYLQFNNTNVQDRLGQDELPLNSLSQANSQPIVTNKPALLNPPAATAENAVADNIPATAGLDPEAARTAVQQVENGVYERATAMFEQEPVDVEWAAGYEQALREMFSQHQGLQRVSINSISCHTSMCRIEVFTPRDADADFFTAMFYDGLANFRDGALKAEAAIARRMAQGMTSVYVARKDHTLGFY
jgi:hypothetical protein